MKSEIVKIIENTIKELNRPDLFREPLVSFSSAKDKKYENLKEIIGPWHLSPKELLPDALSVISYFIPFTRDVVSDPKKSDRGSALWAEAYQEINNHFIKINSVLSQYIEDMGYKAYSIRPTHTYNPSDLKCFWSHRSAAVISGLGSFGANGLVITEKGSGGRFCSLITTAPLKASDTIYETKCLHLKNKSCGRCFDACPVKALTQDSMDKFVCQDKLNSNEKFIIEHTPLSSADICGKCISVCPFAYIE